MRIRGVKHALEYAYHSIAFVAYLLVVTGRQRSLLLLIRRVVTRRPETDFRAVAVATRRRSSGSLISEAV